MKFSYNHGLAMLWTSLVLLVWGTVVASAPGNLGEIASPAELESEARARLSELETLLDQEDAFEERQKRIEQVASLIAVVAQTLVETEATTSLKIRAPQLRDAALEMASSKTYHAAKTGLSDATAAIQGESLRTSISTADWGTFVNQRPIMEEMEVRMQKLQRALRRPKNLVEDRQHATAVAIAGLTSLFDTRHVKEQSQLPEWNRLAARLLDELKQLSTAMKNEQLMEAQAAYKSARATCIECHRQFKKEN